MTIKLDNLGFEFNYKQRCLINTKRKKLYCYFSFKDSYVNFYYIKGFVSITRHDIDILYFSFY